MTLLQFLDQNQIAYSLNEDMSSHTTFRIGGPAEYYITPANERELISVVDSAVLEKIPFLVCGNLSNVVFSDRGYCGAVIDTRLIKQVRLEGTKIICEAGASLTGVSRFAAEQSLSGLEFAYGIPGTVGGGIFMNAGAYGGQTSDIVSQVRVYNFRMKQVEFFDSAACSFDYRTSVFMRSNGIILSCELSLHPGDKTSIVECMEKNIRARREKQPLEYPNAGSVFKRPKQGYVGAMIQELGLKGYRVGGVEVSEKHAGFIVNRGGGTCEDLQRLIMIIKEQVKNSYGVALECEIQFVR